MNIYDNYMYIFYSVFTIDFELFIIGLSIGYY